MNRRHFFKSIGGAGLALVIGKFLPEISQSEISQDKTELSSKTEKVLDEIHYIPKDWELEGDPDLVEHFRGIIEGIEQGTEEWYLSVPINEFDVTFPEYRFESTSNEFPGLDKIITTGFDKPKLGIFPFNADSHINCKCFLE